MLATIIASLALALTPSDVLEANGIDPETGYYQLCYEMATCDGENTLWITEAEKLTLNWSIDAWESSCVFMCIDPEVCYWSVFADGGTTCDFYYGGMQLTGKSKLCMYVTLMCDQGTPAEYIAGRCDTFGAFRCECRDPNCP